MFSNYGRNKQIISTAMENYLEADIMLQNTTPIEATGARLLVDIGTAKRWGQGAYEPHMGLNQNMGGVCD